MLQVLQQNRIFDQGFPRFKYYTRSKWIITIKIKKSNAKLKMIVMFKDESVPIRILHQQKNF